VHTDLAAASARLKPAGALLLSLIISASNRGFETKLTRHPHDASGTSVVYAP